MKRLSQRSPKPLFWVRVPVPLPKIHQLHSWWIFNFTGTLVINMELDLKKKVQEIIGAEAARFVLKGKGACNNIYYFETAKGEKYMIKQERHDKELQEQNSLITEAALAQYISSLHLSTPTPQVRFICEDPAMYGYTYIDGDKMKDVWPSLSENERIHICYQLGRFLAEVGANMNKEVSQKIGIKINISPNLHPEVEESYLTLMNSSDTPDELKKMVKAAKGTLDAHQDHLVFQFLHNDAHHENILIKSGSISGIIDFGDAEYGEIAKEFSRYIEDYPEYFEYIVKSYEEASGNKLSLKRLISNAFLTSFKDIVENFQKGGAARAEAEQKTKTYAKLMDESSNVLH